MTRKVKISSAPAGARETVPGEPAAAHCAGIHTMHPTPGAAPSLDIELIYNMAVAGDADAHDILTSFAFDEIPDAQRLLGYLHLTQAKDPLDCDAALAWFRRGSAHGDMKSQLALIGVLLSRAGCGELAALSEAIPYIRELESQGEPSAIAAAEYLEFNGYEIETEGNWKTIS